MTTNNESVNRRAPGGVAGIRNVQICYEALARTQKRHAALPGISAFYGPSGWGKSLAATQIAVRLRAHYIQVLSTWQRKTFMQKLLKEMGIVPARTVADMVDQASEELHRSQRPLIVDEFDHMVTNGKVELVRDIYETSRATILLIGEEMLPKKLEKWERFHGRVLHWMPALPVNLDDARLLVPIYSPLVTVADEVLEDLIRTVRGSTRRVGNNLTYLQQVALENGCPAIDLAAWRRLAPNGWITGDSPKPRAY